MPMLLVRSALVAGLATLLSCGGAVPVAASSPAAAPPVAVAPAPAPFDFVLPAGASVTASCDLASVNFAAILDLLGPLDQPLRAELTSLVPQLRTGGTAAVLDAVGIDPSRPIALAEAATSDEGLVAIAALRALVPPAEPEGVGKASPTPGLFLAMKTTLEKVPAIAVYRVLIPAKSAERVRGTLDALLLLSGWTKGATAGEFTRRHALAIVTGDGDTVAFDLALGDDPRTALAALRASAHAQHDEPVPLEHDALRIAYVPERVAELGFLAGASTTTHALAGVSIEAQQRERIAVEGLWESAQNLVIVRNARGARFERVELRVSADPVHSPSTLRSEPGPGFEGPPDEAWGTTFTAVSSPIADVSRPFLEAWKVPGAATSAFDGTAFLRTLRDGGASALVAAAPDLGVSGAGMLGSHELAPNREVLGRLARFGVTRAETPANASASTANPVPRVFFGVLPDGTTRAAAECVLVGAAPCGAHKLAVGSVTKDAGARVLLTQVEGRYVLLRAADARSLKLKLQAGSAPPLRVELDVHALPFVPPDLPLGTVVGTLRREGRTIVVDLVPQ